MHTQTNNLALDIQASIASAYRRPVIFDVVRLLGLRNSTVADALGVSLNVVRVWASGRYRPAPLPRPRQRQLFTLCREAHAEALRVIVAANAEPDKTATETEAIAVYSDRVLRAGRILNEVVAAGAI